MTSKQIKFILNQLNSSFSESGILYGEDVWINAKEIAAIILGTDENVYPDETCEVYFSSSDETLKCRLLKKKKNGEVLMKDPYLITSYKNIVGFILADELHPRSAYKRGLEV